MRKTFLIMLAMLQVASANNENFEQGKKMAQSGNATFKEQPDFKNFKAENYNNNQPIDSSAAESFFDKSDAEIKAAGVNAMAKDQNVIPIQEHHKNRKPLNPVDNPTLDRMKYIMAHSKEISHGQSTEKYQCSEVQANCVTKKVNHDCLSADVKTVQCHYKPQVVIKDATIPPQDQSFDLTSSSFSRSHPCYGYMYFNLPYTGVLKSLEIILNGGFHGGTTHYWLWVHPFHPSTIDYYHNYGATFSLRLNPYSHVTQNQQVRLEINGREWIPVPDFSIRYRGIIQIPARTKQEAHVSWSNTCNPVYLNQCTKIKEVCIEPKATRTFGSQSVTLNCWNYQQTYQCGNPNINTCGQYQSCDFIQKICSQTIGDYCVQHKETYQCIEEHCDSNQMICGKPTAFCLDGDCQTNASEDNEKQFGPAVSALAALFNAGQEIKDQQNQGEIFKGRPRDCGKTKIYNCCVDRGASVKECSENEKELLHLRQKGLAIHVGEHCAKKAPLIGCILWHEGWCVYDNQLARIINQAAKDQIPGFNFGTSEQLNCAGVTPEILSQIQFDQVDFSSIVGELVTQKHLPDTNKLNQNITDAAKATLQDNERVGKIQQK